jgi:predicted alpha/beta-fold hydrolase
MHLKCLAVLLAASITCATASAAPAPKVLANQPLQTLTPAQVKVQAEALNAFRSQRYSAAFGRFAALADAGHVPSAEIALVMLSYGSNLFGSDWSASAPQQASWHALVINNRRSRAVALDEGKAE